MIHIVLVSLLLSWAVIGGLKFIFFIHKSDISDIRKITNKEAQFIIIRYGPLLWLMFLCYLLILLFDTIVDFIKHLLQQKG